MTRRLALTLAVCAALARADSVDDYIKDVMASQHIPAVTLAVIRDGVPVRTQAYGAADIENNLAARTDSVFKIGSVSKQFVAAGIMVLVQDGKVALEDRIAKYLPGAPKAWEAITVRHALTHTAGLVREGPAFDPYKVQPDIEVIKSAYETRLLSKPGEKWEYSNLGYFILGEIIRQAGGKPWPQFLRERVFQPLGMSATRETTVAEIVPNRARGYVWASDKYQNAPDWPAVRPSGAFFSTIVDMAKWEDALREGKVLTESSKRAMWTPVPLNNGKTYPYGFGWELNDWPNRPGQPPIPMIRHEGSIPGFRAGYFRWPTYGLTVIVLTNRQDAPIEGIGANIAIRVIPELRTQ